MNRRQLLQTVAGSGVIGAPLLSGCLGESQSPNDDSNTDESTVDRTSYDWCVSGNLEVDTVVRDTVFAQRDITDRRAERREVVALSAKTGSPNWSYETERSVDHFTALTVHDGVFLTRSGPQDGNGLVALNMDGTERWTQDTAVGHRRPHVVDGTVYVSRDTGLVQAFDAASGDQRWEYVMEDGRLNSRIVDATDTVVVETGYTVLGFDPTEGTVRWEFETDDQQIFDTRVRDGIAYVVTGDRIAASSDGTEQWSTTFDTHVGTETRIVGTTSDRVFVLTENDDRDDYRHHAFDIATGERSWTSEAIQGQPEWDPRATVFGDIAYIGGDKLRAVDAQTGDERWQASVGDEPIRALTVIDDGGTADHTVFAYGSETQLATFTPDGEQTWTHPVDTPDRVSAIGEYVFVGTDSEICALNRLDSS